MNNTYISTIQFLALFFQDLQLPETQRIDFSAIWTSMSLTFRIISACAPKPELQISNWVKQWDTLTKMNMYIKNNKIVEGVKMVEK